MCICSQPVRRDLASGSARGRRGMPDNGKFTQFIHAGAWLDVFCSISCIWSIPQSKPKISFPRHTEYSPSLAKSRDVPFHGIAGD